MLAILLVGLIAAGPAGASALIGDTKAPFSAERTVVWKGKTYLGRIYAVPGRQRHEEDINGIRIVAILRADRQLAYLVLPDLHIFSALPFPKAVTEYGGMEQLGSPVGATDLNGEHTDQYKVHKTGSDGSALDGNVWITRDAIIVKIVGHYTDPGHAPEEGTLILSNIARAPQNPALFEIPPDMKELPPDAVEGLFKMRLPKFSH